MTELIPLPVAPPVTVIQATLLTAVHEQLVPVTTLNAPAVVPVDGTDALVDPRLYEQISAEGVTVDRADRACNED